MIDGSQKKDGSEKYRSVPGEFFMDLKSFVGVLLQVFTAISHTCFVQ